jgi:hypothetical protein
MTAIKNLLIPMYFAIDKAPHQWHIELNFSRGPEKNDTYVPESGNAWQKADQLYRKHAIYGDHQFLIPVLQEMTDSFGILPSNTPGAFKQIGKDPTTAVAYQKLQLMPCARANLGLIQSRMQAEPFYLEIGKRSYVLYVWHQNMFWKIPCHRHAPMNWFGHPHPVITTETVSGPVAFLNFRDIPWSDIAQQLGSPVVPKQLTEPPRYGY